MCSDVRLEEEPVHCSLSKPLLMTLMMLSICFLFVPQMKGGHEKRLKKVRHRR